MPRYRESSIFDKFIEQEKTPVFTVVSLPTNFTVWAVVIAVFTHPVVGWGGIGQALILYFALAVGVFGNLIFGPIAVAREEYCGGRIVLLGMAPWVLTILFITLFRHGHLWP